MNTPTQFYDFVIIGSGIAGASVAYYLGKLGASCVVLEMEDLPSYHTTGRSAAFLLPLYGGPKVAPLTHFSKQFYEHPPHGFTDTMLLQHRGALHVANESQVANLTSYFEQSAALATGIELRTAKQVCAQVPLLSEEYVAGGFYDPNCYDLDVAAIHTGFLKGARLAGAELITGAEVRSINKDEHGWLVTSKAGQFRAKTIVNAAGAWGDDVAQMAGVKEIGLQALRRTIAVLAINDEVDSKWPLVIDVDEKFYFRPEGENVLASPADETPSPACDAQPEVEDIAKTIHDMQQATGKTIDKVTSKWAGLRTFTPDRVPAMGFDANEQSFFWCVGQGGFGIQTAAAMGEVSANLLLGLPIPKDLAETGFDLQAFQPSRFC